MCSYVFHKQIISFQAYKICPKILLVSLLLFWMFWLAVESLEGTVYIVILNMDCDQ